VKRFLCFVLCLAFPCAALAQETAAPVAEEFRLPDPGEILPLRRGTPAPRDGLLIGADEMLQIQMEYDRMRYLLGRTSERDRELCDVRIEMERARLLAAEERLRLRDELWGGRQAELAAAIEEARRQAAEAGQRGWYESPALWFTVGAIVVGAIWIAATVR
jgi:hypothetical protein